MVHPEISSPAGDQGLRRIALVLRRSALGLVGITALAAVAAFAVTASAASVYSSESVIELTDNIAQGISSTGQRPSDARVEIEAQRRLIESSAFLVSLSDRIDVPDGELIGIVTSTPEQTPVIVVSVEAETVETAELAASAIVDFYVELRIQNEVDRLEGELVPLRTQRVDQQDLVTSIVDELAVTRVTGSVDEVSVLENRAASALNRLDEYDVAIQEREFFQQTVVGNVRVVEAAGTAIDASASAVTRAIQFGLLGLLVALGSVIAISRLRGRLLLLDEVRSVVGPNVPILATVPRFRSKFRKGKAAVVVGVAEAAREAESFRYARSAIEVAAEGKSPLSVLITSSRSNEGKTVTSANLALASALSGRSTALLDGDLLNSSLEKIFEADKLESAFRPLLSGEINVKTQAWFHVGESGPGLDVLLAPPHPSETDRQELSVDSVGRVLRSLKKSWDVVVVDAPPVLAVSDAMILARTTDVTVLIVRIGTTARRDLETSITQLRQGGVNLAGVIVTQTRERGESYYGHDYNYAREAKPSVDTDSDSDETSPGDITPTA